jgi:tetrahydromethanopterin S-methyltransferase subunit C
MTTFRKALVGTATPIVILSFISMAGTLRGHYFDDFTPVYFAWLGALGLWLLAILATIVFAVSGRRQIASGILAGIGIGTVSLGVTCFANTNIP